MGGNIIKQDILIVLSPKENPEQLSSMLASHGFTATTAQNVQTAFDYLNSHISAFLLLDLDLEGCQRQFKIVRKRRRNFVVLRRGG